MKHDTIVLTSIEIQFYEFRGQTETQTAKYWHKGDAVCDWVAQP